MDLFQSVTIRHNPSQSVPCIPWHLPPLSASRGIYLLHQPTMDYTISTNWSSQYNHHSKEQLAKYSTQLKQWDQLLVLVHGFDEIGVLCSNKDVSSKYDKFYLDEDPYHIHHHSGTGTSFYILQCIIITHSKQISRVLFKHPIGQPNTLHEAVIKLCNHYNDTNSIIYMVVPTPSYAEINKSTDFLFKFLL